MDNVFLNNYEKLNAQGKFYVDCALKAAMSQPANLSDTPEEELQEIKRQQEASEQIRKVREEMEKRYFEELKAECDTMSHDDYIEKLNKVFAELPIYKLRYFFLFINGKLHYDTEGGVC